MCTLSVVTFNIRYDCKEDAGNCFKYRKSLIEKKIKQESPDIIGFQEMLPHVVEWFKENFTEYEIVGHGRGSDYQDEHTAVAYKKDKLRLFGLETFWLSPTPHIPGSRFKEQSICPRTCTVVTLKHKDMDKPLRIYNTHLDHEGEEARLLGIGLILERIRKDYETFKLPSFLMGDFNATPECGEIQVIEKESPLRDITGSITYTFHDYDRLEDKIKIDYIYITEEIQCSAARAWTDIEEGVYLSDHYPVQVSIEVK